MAGRGTAVLLVISLLGLIALGVYSSGRFGPAMTAQIAVSFAIPALLMVIFWRAARTRLQAREEQMQLSSWGWSASPTGPPGNSWPASPMSSYRTSNYAM